VSLSGLHSTGSKLESNSWFYEYDYEPLGSIKAGHL